MMNVLEIYHDLKETMDEAAAEKIVAHLGRMYDELRSLPRRKDFFDLRGVIRELADAQQRTEQKVEALAHAQEALANAQTRTESAIQELVAAHKDLEKSHHRLAQQVGGLSDAIGGDIEDMAYALIFRVLSDTFDWQIGDLGRVWHTWDNKPEEVNIFGKATDPARSDATIWIIGEAKHNLTLKELRRFLKQLERARRHLQGEICPICFCYRARPEVQQTAQQAGIYLLFSYGKLLYPAQPSGAC